MHSDSSSSLLFSDVEVTDNNANTIPAVIYGGMIGIRSGVQEPIVFCGESCIDCILMDAAYCGTNPTGRITAVAAFYHEGQMLFVDMVAGSISFDDNGLAHFHYDLEYPAGTDQVRLFFIRDAGGFIPMCESISVQLN